MNEITPRRNPLIPGSWMEGGPLASLRSEVDNLFEHFFGVPVANVEKGMVIPSVDVSETEDAIEVKTDVPGFKADDISVEVRDDYLTISGEYSQETKSEGDEKKKYHRVERRTGSFTRSVRLPCDVKSDSIDAELKDGVLTVMLPKTKESKARKISIRS